MGASRINNVAGEKLADLTNVRLTIAFNTISIHMELSDSYTASVLFDDLSGLLQKGKPLVLRCGVEKEQ